MDRNIGRLLAHAVPIPDRGVAEFFTSGGEMKTICRVLSVAAAGHDPVVRSASAKFAKKGLR